MDTATIILLILGLCVAIVVLVVILAAVLLFRRLQPALLPAPPDPFQQITGQVGAISTWLDIYQKQFQALSERYERLERDFRALEDRADRLDASNTILSDKLVAAYSHIEYIYRFLDGTPAGAGWVQSLRERDPRYRPTPPGEGSAPPN